jgi:hypothetical protein
MLSTIIFPNWGIIPNKAKGPVRKTGPYFLQNGDLTA